MRRRTAPDQKQYAANLRQQRQQDEPEHGKVFGYRPQQATGNPSDKLDGGVGLRVRRFPDGGRCGIEDLASFCDRSFPLAAEFPHAALALAVAGHHRVIERGLRHRDGRRDA